MDQRNLEVLLKLKEAMKESAGSTPEAPEPSKYTKHGLELLKAFAAEITAGPRKKAKSDSIKSSGAPKKKPKSKPSSSPKRRHPDPYAKAKFELRAQAEAAFRKDPSKYRRCSSCDIPVLRGEPVLQLPFMCSHCKSRYKEIDLGIHVRANDGFSEARVFQGGAPGLGKGK